MYTILVLSLFLCVITSDAGTIKGSDKTYQLGYKYYPEVGWVYFHPIPVQWAKARVRCFYEGAELMSPLNEKMLQVMTEVGKKAMWTGVHDTYSKGDYYSIGGVPMFEMPITWAKDEPDNENDSEDCLIVLPDGTMADCSCNESYPFSCYKENAILSPHCGGLKGYEYDEKTGNCYKFHSLADTWNRAFMLCAAEGAHLAVIDSTEEKEVIQKLFNEYPSRLIRGANYSDGIHLGYRDWDSHKLWMSINGKKIDDQGDDFLIVYSGYDEPNNVEEYCGGIDRDGFQNNVRVPCDYKMPFVCEYEIEKNNSLLSNS